GVPDLEFGAEQVGAGRGPDIQPGPGELELLPCAFEPAPGEGDELLARAGLEVELRRPQNRLEALRLEVRVRGDQAGARAALLDDPSPAGEEVVVRREPRRIVLGDQTPRGLVEAFVARVRIGGARRERREP